MYYWTPLLAYLRGNLNSFIPNSIIKLILLETYSLLVNETIISFFDARSLELLPCVSHCSALVWATSVSSSYTNSSSVAALVIFIVFKLNYMISLSEMLLWLCNILRIKSRFFCRTYQTFHHWTVVSCHILVPNSPVCSKCSVGGQLTQFHGLSIFSITSESSPILFPPALSVLNAFLSFIPNGKLLVF